MESPGRGTIQHPRQGHQEGRVLRTTTWPVGRNDSQRPIPNQKAQGCDPLIHWGKPKHGTAEKGGNKQTHTSPPPLPVGHSRVEESPALSRRWVPEATLCVEVSPTISSRYLSTSRTSSGSFPPNEVVGPLGDGLASLAGAWPSRVPRGATRPPGALRQVPTPGLAPGWDPGSAVPGDVTCLDILVLMKDS
ncbi:hypothetical protein CRENBAI_020077 [Crenichthys baileyi]|uniref:Uncharacterized protein n=1 Tax=Crenichthys baileyi TaxID=28760 RepID=A0AAV9RIK4_9TELE